MLRIRLKRFGRKHQPSFRIVVAEARSPRDGKAVDELGHYNPLREPPEIVVDLARADEWIRKGAQPTDTVKRLLAKARRAAAAAATPPAQA